MGILSQIQPEVLETFTRKFKQQLDCQCSFEEAAQCFTENLYKEFSESIVLARLFATLPYNQLPLNNQIAVDALAQKRCVTHEIRPTTPVLSLVGTSGQETLWNSRGNSKEHMGLPLSSAAFIDSIPMISRLLSQLGIGMTYIDQNETNIVKRTMGLSSGIFYVHDAATEKDVQGRLIIPAQKFVTKYNIKTVFGFGGRYLENSTFYTTILFLNETLAETKARQISAGLSFFKTLTTELVKEGIFSDSVGVNTSSVT